MKTTLASFPMPLLAYLSDEGAPDAPAGKPHAGVLSVPRAVGGPAACPWVRHVVVGTNNLHHQQTAHRVPHTVGTSRAHDHCVDHNVSTNNRHNQCVGHNVSTPITVQVIMLAQTTGITSKLVTVSVIIMLVHQSLCRS